eukprot:jgi/Mesvir1/24556/Mv21891-RA.1
MSFQCPEQSCAAKCQADIFAVKFFHNDPKLSCLQVDFRNPLSRDASSPSKQGFEGSKNGFHPADKAAGVVAREPESLTHLDESDLLTPKLVDVLHLMNSVKQLNLPPTVVEAISEAILRSSLRCHPSPACCHGHSPHDEDACYEPCQEDDIKLFHRSEIAADPEVALWLESTFGITSRSRR